ncbi:hypothetical protein MNBD_GAMMA12-3407 [hydrothermal vent metagenome]|uniref:Uncharacterized protein n=1 Tax=hydrothermal vent metagenome TaxID=652676 RepID=A0A3B0YSU9_9ZZZZ
MTSQQITMLIYLIPSLMMCAMAFSRMSKFIIASTGMILATSIGIILTLCHVPNTLPIFTLPYLPLVFILFLSGVSLAIILVLQRYIQSFFHNTK